ncbi:MULTISPECIES: TadE/TadG family type IV pilus assembly protein [Phenylobacterium]|uniref:Flp pilus assembly protein TadG n=1 Tax=Phenylobacterium koreense TaxID=266125 RepID=A0ABV2EGT0_9CAUL
MRRFIGDKRGVAVVEFALILPILLLLYFGMVETSQAVLANRRAGYLTTAVGDLLTQQAQVRSADVEDIFDAGTAVLTPFTTDGLSIRVTSIEIDANGVATEKWTQDRGTIDPADLSDIDPKLLEPNSALVRAETVYVFRTPFQKVLPQAFTFKHKMDLRPRTGVAIPLID